jgi:fimbrial chaperone protein
MSGKAYAERVLATAGAVALALSASLLPGAAVGAGIANTVSVAPARLMLSDKQTSANITVSNTGSASMVVQIETMQWSQAEGREILDLSTAMLANPSTFTLPANGKQVVKVNLKRPPDQRKELTYRIVLREVPPPDRADEPRLPPKASMPAFISPNGANAAPALQWRAMRVNDGIRLVAYNTGNAHVQMGPIDVAHAASGKPLATYATDEYLLPNDSRTWNLNSKSAPAVGTLLRVSSQTDAGAVQSDVALETESAGYPRTTAAR